MSLCGLIQALLVKTVLAIFNIRLKSCLLSTCLLRKHLRLLEMPLLLCSRLHHSPEMLPYGQCLLAGRCTSSTSAYCCARHFFSIISPAFVAQYKGEVSSGTRPRQDAIMTIFPFASMILGSAFPVIR